MAVENRTAAFQGAENYFVRKGLTPLEEPTITGMKLLGDVSLGSLTLNTRETNGTVWVCTDIENWWTLAEPDFPSVERAFGDGSYDVSGRYQARELRLEGVILVPQPSLVPAARDTLAQALNLVYSGAWLKTVERQATKNANIAAVSIASNVATVTLSGVNPFIVGDVVTVASSNAAFNGNFTLTASAGSTVSYALTGTNLAQTPATGSIESGDSLVKAAFVRLGGQPEIEVTNARGRVRFRADLTAADPIKYQWYPANDGYQSIAISPKNATLSGEYTVNNIGNATVGGVITLSGPVSGPLTIENTTTKQTLTVTANLVGGSTTKNVVKRSYFNGTATLTTNGAHGFYVGKTVTVAGVDAAFNGTHVVTAIPTDTSFSYALNIPRSGTFTSYKLGEVVQLTSRTVGGGTATFTASAPHLLTEGMEVLLAGFTGDAAVLNTHFEIDSVPSATTFTVKTAVTLPVPTASTTATATAPIVTLFSNSALPFAVGDLITVTNVSRQANIRNGTVLSVAPDNLSIRYYANRTRAIKFKSYEPSNSTEPDVVTLTTWEGHGYQVGETVFVQGCGRPINNDSSTIEISPEIVSRTDDTFSFTVPSFKIGTSTVSVAKASGKYYRVTVTTDAAHKFVTGDTVLLTTPLKTGRSPAGLNGRFAVTSVNATRYYYDVIPKSTTNTGLVEFFGVASGAVPINGTAAKSTLAPFDDQTVNSDGQNSTGGRAISFATVPLTNISGSGSSQAIEETTSTGTVTAGGDELVIDTNKRSVLLNGQAQFARGKLAPVTDWIRFTPGANAIKVIDAGNAASTATATLKFRSGWLA